MASPHDFLLIGAGISGLKAARDLQAAGQRVLVLDKGRGVGGRAATRRWDGAPVDHGAQFFTARSEAFLAQTDDWLARGVCFEWARGFHQYNNGQLRAPDAAESHPRYACRAGMSALGKDLADGLTIQTGARAVGIVRKADGWQVETDGERGSAVHESRGLILSLPVPQALALLDESDLLDALDPDARRTLEAVEVSPAIAVLLRGPAPAPEWKGIQLRDDMLSWIGFDSDKRTTPDAPGDGRRVFVLHAAAGFSRDWQDIDLQQAAARMVARAGEIVGDWITRLPERQVHRWRFAHVARGVENVPFLRATAEGSPLYLAGDAFLGSKIEGAFCSGQHLAAEIIAGAA